MEEVCSKCCVAGECISSRSLGATLVGDMATFAVFVAANWEFAPLVSIETDYAGKLTQSTLLIRFCIHAVAAIFWPFNAFLFTLENFCVVLMMRAKFPELHKGRNVSVNDMTSCPILIQIPSTITAGYDFQLAAVKKWAEEKGIHANQVVTYEEIEKLYPLELSPASAQSAASAGSQSAAPDEYIVAAAATGYQSSSDHEKKYYIRLRSGKYRVRDVQQRVALLQLGLSPEYKQLAILRSRGPFMVLVTMLQAVGSLLSVIQRVVGRLGISPLEAILNYLCLLITVQLLMELKACTHYQRYLLLRLTLPQFQSFVHASSRVPLHHAASSPFIANPFFVEHKKATISVTIFGCVMLLACLLLSPAPLFHYSLSIRPHCHICYLSTFFFCVFSVYSESIIQVADLLAARKMCKIFYIVMRSLLHLVYVSSIILSVAATILRWELFKTSSGDILYAWLVPHLSTNS